MKEKDIDKIIKKFKEEIEKVYKSYTSGHSILIMDILEYSDVIDALNKTLKEN